MNFKFDSLDDIKDIDLGPSSPLPSTHNSNRPNLVIRDPPRSFTPTSSSGRGDSSIGLDLIINKDKQKKPSPRSSPITFSAPVEEPKSSFTRNMYNKIDNETPSLSLNIGDNLRGGGNDFSSLDDFLKDDIKSSDNRQSNTIPSPVEIKPPSGNIGFNFNDDLLTPEPQAYTFNQQHTQQNTYMPSPQAPEKPMSIEERQQKKFELLCKLERLKRKGVIVPRTYTMNSDYEEIKFEYEKLHNERLMDNSVKMYRQMLVSATTALEYFNTKANPIDFYLDGWSDHVYSQQHDYDEMFEEMYEKYKDKGSLPVELRLALSLGGSALMYHLSNTMFKSVLPGAQDILRQNPDLMKHMQQTLLSTMAQQGPHEANLAGMMAGSMGVDPTQRPPFNNPSAPPRNAPAERRQMSGPSGLDNFLNDITGNKNGDSRNINVDLS
jgi:hypothetical protein